MKGNRLDFALSLALPGYGLRARQRICKTGGVTSGEKMLPPGFILPSDDFQVQILLGPDDFTDGIGQETANFVKRIPGIFIVAMNRNFAALSKPFGLATARIKGKGTQSLEGLLPEIWRDLLDEFCQNKASGLEGCMHGLSVPVTVNRLDGPTSGLVLTAFSQDDAALFRRLELAGEIDKVYYVLTHGRICEDMLLDKRLNTRDRDKTLVMDEAEHDRLRHTLVKPLQTFFDDLGNLCTLARVHIKRGARHQIRAHLSDAGFPIRGDALYALPGHPVCDGGVLGERLYLHHARIFLPGFSAILPPNWGLGEEEDLASVSSQLTLP